MEAAGDFTMLSKRVWTRTFAYPQVPWIWQVDAYMLCKIGAVQEKAFQELVLPGGIHHQRHVKRHKLMMKMPVDWVECLSADLYCRARNPSDRPAVYERYRAKKKTVPPLHLMHDINWGKRFEILNTRTAACPHWAPETADADEENAQKGFEYWAYRAPGELPYSDEFLAHLAARKAEAEKSVRALAKKEAERRRIEKEKRKLSLNATFLEPASGTAMGVPFAHEI
jgi:hypothetical protein